MLDIRRIPCPERFTMPESEFFGQTQASLRALQDTLCAELGRLDGRSFGRDPWTRTEGGGGMSRVLDERIPAVAGATPVFEKAAVLFSGIRGTRLPESVLKENPEVPPGTEFYAAGVSLICHPHNPYVPTVHF